MTVIRVDVDVNARAELAWEIVSDPGNLAHWDRHIAGVQDVPPTGLREGSVYVTVMRFMGVRVRVPSKVIEWDPPQRATFRLKGPIEATVTTTITARDDDRCVLAHEVDYRFRGGPLGELASRSLARVGGARYALRRGALAQKRDIERQA